MRPWSALEDAALRRLHAAHGEAWGVLATRLANEPGCTPARTTCPRALAEAQIGACAQRCERGCCFGWNVAPDPRFYVQGELKS